MVRSNSFPNLRPLMPVAWVVGVATAALTAHAEPTARASQPDPLDPKASVPSLTYESSFKLYRRLGDEQPVSWREANDTVNRIGGWRVYAREAQQPEPAPAAKLTPPMPASKLPEPANRMPLPVPPAMPQGHGDHKMP